MEWNKWFKTWIWWPNSTLSQLGLYCQADPLNLSCKFEIANLKLIDEKHSQIKLKNYCHFQHVRKSSLRTTVTSSMYEVLTIFNEDYLDKQASQSWIFVDITNIMCTKTEVYIKMIVFPIYRIYTCKVVFNKNFYHWTYFGIQFIINGSPAI